MLASSEHRIIIGHVNLSKNGLRPLGHITYISETWAVVLTKIHSRRQFRSVRSSVFTS
jgi:hypothetical protein